MTQKRKRGINHLYHARRNRGYLQKHVAALVGHRFARMISQYENGASLPTLETALMLEIILGVRLSELYFDLYQELHLLVLRRAETLPDHLRRRLISRLLGKDAI
jgi:transcriptional regulator with XRE-family HTH domain